MTDLANMTRSQRWAARNPQKRAAHKAVEKALRTGALVKTPCVDCGATDRLHACHDDYARPLDVVFKCPACHIGKDHWASGDFRGRSTGVRYEMTVTTTTVVTTVTTVKTVKTVTKGGN